MARSAYKFNLSLALILDKASADRRTNYESSSVKYIVIESLYEERYIPVIYLSLSLKLEEAQNLLNHKEDAKLYFKLTKYNSNTELATIDKPYIDGLFKYFSSTDVPTYMNDLNPDKDKKQPDQYMTFTVALLNMNIIDNIKTSFNGILRDIDISTLLVNTLEGINTIVKPLAHNAELKTHIVPPFNNRCAIINEIFEDFPFYDSNFIFFIDTSVAYLLDTSGTYVEDNSGISTIRVNIPSLTNANGKTYEEGFTITGDIIDISIPPMSINVIENKVTDKIANKVIKVSVEGDVEAIELPDDKDIVNPKLMFTRNKKHIGLYKNDAIANKILLEFTKRDIDSSIFTPNKQIVVKCDHDAERLNGSYSLVSKKEVIANNKGEFTSNVMISLRKVDGIIPLNGDIELDASKHSYTVEDRYLEEQALKAKDGSTTIETVNNAGEKITIEVPVSAETTETISTTNTETNPAKIPDFKRIKVDTDKYIQRVIRQYDEGGSAIPGEHN